MDKVTLRKLIEDRIFNLFGDHFQIFCDYFLMKFFPDDYIPVRAGGQRGDEKNDGYCPKQRIFFQCHAGRGEEVNKVTSKITNDFKGCLIKHPDVKKWIYLTNDNKLTGQIESHIDSLRLTNKQVELESWGGIKIAEEMITRLTVVEIEDILKISHSGSIYEQKAINNGSGVQFNNQGNMQVYYQQNANSEQKDFGIIREIINYIFEGIKLGLNKQSNAKENLTKIKVKIPLNFSENQINRISTMYKNALGQIGLVKKYLEVDIASESSRIDALREKVQADFCKTASVDNHNDAINEVQVIEDLALQYVPKDKRENPEYIMNAKSIILYFFEMCDIGKKTPEEIQTKLFEKS